jgi:hypothetical protein
MAGDWETVSLSQLCEQIADCPHSTALWTDSGVIVLRNQNIRDGRLVLSSPSYTDEAHFEQRSRRARLKAGDALATNNSAVQAMGDAKLKLIAAELISQVKKSVTIDWTLRESARARIRVMVKRILNKYGYPPDLQAEAVKTVLAQAELLCAQWL